MEDAEYVFLTPTASPYRVLKIGKFSKKRVNWTWGGPSKGFLLTWKDVLDATTAGAP